MKNDNEKHEYYPLQNIVPQSQVILVKSSVINYDYPSGPLGLYLGCNVGQGKGYNRVEYLLKL